MSVVPQTVTPYLLDEDAGTAIEWLAKAFGFRVDAHCARAREAGAQIFATPLE